MNGPNPLLIPARQIPFPKSISRIAQSSLASLAARDREPFPAPDDALAWEGYAARTEKGLRDLPLFSGVDDNAVVQELDLGALRMFLALPRVGGDREDRVIYDLHGGGFVMGGGTLCRLTTMRAAVMFGARTYGVDYRMPPRHPYPAALDDCLAGYHFLLDYFPAHQIVVQGGSAGGNLAAALILRIRDQGLQFPAGIILVSPELDLTESGDSFRTLAGVDPVLKGSLMNANILYANGRELRDPEISPLFGDFQAGFPPALITAGTRDLFLSNAVRMHNSLRRAGNHCELLLEEAMPHGGFLGSPEDSALCADIVDFAERAWRGQFAR